MTSGASLRNVDIAVRVGTLTFVTDSSAVGATETSVGSVTCSLENGARYGVWVFQRISSDTAASPSAEISCLRVREDTSSGNQIGTGIVYLAGTAATGWSIAFYCEYTAASTASKTFHLTMQRINGASTTNKIRADSASPGFVLVERIPT